MSLRLTSPRRSRARSPGGILILGVSIAVGVGLLLLTASVAGRLGETKLEDLKAIAQFVAVVAGIPAAIFALFNYAADVGERKRAEMWRRRQFVDERFRQFEDVLTVQSVMTMLDYWNRRVSLPGAAKDILVTNDVLTQALAPKSKYTRDEASVRDAFDEFFDGMDRLGVMRDADLVSIDDLLPYVGYWLRLLDSAPRHRSPEFGPVVRTYIHSFHFDALERLMNAAGVRTYSTDDQRVVDDYVESLGDRG